MKVPQGSKWSMKVAEGFYKSLNIVQAGSRKFKKVKDGSEHRRDGPEGTKPNSISDPLTTKQPLLLRVSVISFVQCDVHPIPKVSIHFILDPI